MLLERYLTDTDAYAALENTDAGSPLTVTGMTEGTVSLTLAALSSQRRVLYVAPGEWAAMETAAGIPGALYLPPRETLLRPAMIGRDTSAKRLLALGRLADAACVCVSFGTLRQRMCPPEITEAARITISYAQETPPDEIAVRLVRAGYEREAAARDAGQFALRGDILDVAFCDGAVRIEFFGDTVERISTLDTETQRSGRQSLNTAVIPPACELLCDKKAGKLARELLKTEYERVKNDSSFELIAGKIPEYLDALESERPFDDLRNLLPGIYRPVSLLDLMDGAVTVFGSYAAVCSAANIADSEFAAQLQTAVMSGYALTGMENLLFSRDYVTERAMAGRCADFAELSTAAEFKNGRTVSMGARRLHMPGVRAELPTLLAGRREAGWTAIVCTGSESRAATLTEKLASGGAAVTLDETADSPAFVTADGVAQGFEMPDTKLIVLGVQDVYGKAAKKQKKKNRAPVSVIGELKAGDFIVHDAYGRGRYLGMETKEVTGTLRDYVMIEYRDGDRLYLPVDQLSRIQKYTGGGDGEPQLSKLGGHEWENAKAKAKASLKEMAGKLFALYSKRASARGHMFAPDTVWQAEFEDAFDYDETEGQAAAIADIKADMESERVMDRLLLGDVGYGKTEVAMRACMKAVCDGKQCAVLAPTTLLASQHYETFTERFAGFPVSCVLLSRFVPPKEQRAAILKLASGEADIAIGTHRLLSKDVSFKDLGLLVIDEEHKFGVASKERIKELAVSVDVLSMTATPIPRTLEMSLTGIRDMSAIETPIEERIPVTTFVLEYSTDLVREAVLREKARGGQMFFVCRRISTLSYIASQFDADIPEASYRTAHGQLPKDELEQIMADFVAGEFDVLITTTIVESGLDIKSANTMLVYEADMFGISELYQLKGRVGRSSVQAYAYLTYMAEERLTADARSRLSALRDFTEFGSGRKIAMRDLEIRGAGNLLGAEQSGHIVNVGYELYMRMMKDAVDELKGLPARAELPDTSIELNMDAHIPAGYIENAELRLDAYKKIAQIRSKAAAMDVRDELAERYGEAPKSVVNLIAISLLRAAATSRGVASVTKKSAMVEIKLRDGANIDGAATAKALTEIRGAKLSRAAATSILLKGEAPRISDVMRCVLAIKVKK